jgi:hypothetical protein
MPQLDKISIFTEVFFLFGAFLTLFFYTSYKILPELALLMKVKKAMSEPKNKDLEVAVVELEKAYQNTINDTMDGFYATNLNLVKQIDSDKTDETLRTGLTTFVEEALNTELYQVSFNEEEK